MRIINEDNLLIQRHKRSKGEAPLPNDFPSYTEFLTAHRAYLLKLKADNRICLGRIFRLMRENQGNSSFFAFCSGLIHIRKEYGAYLTRGIDACSRVLAGF